MTWRNKNLRIAYVIYLGLFWGMTLTLVALNWRIALVSVVAGTLASGATASEERGKE